MFRHLTPISNFHVCVRNTDFPLAFSRAGSRLTAFSQSIWKWLLTVPQCFPAIIVWISRVTQLAVGRSTGVWNCIFNYLSIVRKDAVCPGSYYTWQGQCIYNGCLHRLIPYKNTLTESAPPASCSLSQLLINIIVLKTILSTKASVITAAPCPAMPN